MKTGFLVNKVNEFSLSANVKALSFAATLLLATNGANAAIEKIPDWVLPQLTEVTPSCESTIQKHSVKLIDRLSAIELEEMQLTERSLSAKSKSISQEMYASDRKDLAELMESLDSEVGEVQSSRLTDANETLSAVEKIQRGEKSLNPNQVKIVSALCEQPNLNVDEVLTSSTKQIPSGSNL